MKPRKKKKRSISIRFKVYTVIISVLLVFIAGFVTFHKILKRQDKLDIYEQNKELRKSVTALLAKQNEFLGYLANDYGYYDWMCDFVDQPDSIGASENITSPDLLGIDFFKVYNLKAQPVYEQFSEKIGRDSVCFNESFFKELKKKSRLSFYYFSGTERYLVYAGTIHPSSDVTGVTEPSGYVVIGKSLDSLFFKGIKRLLSCQLEIYDTKDLIPDGSDENNTMPLISYNSEQIGAISVFTDKTNDQLLKPLNTYIRWLIVFTFFIVSLIIIVAYRRIVLKPLVIIEDALNKSSEKEVRRLMYKRDEFGKIARLIIRFFQQRDNLTNKIDQLIQTKEELNFLNNQLQIQKEELQTTATSLLDANESINFQKKLITDNIYYASVVQRAVLIPSMNIQEVFSEHFIMFKPKDVISGDFYWFKKLYNKYFVAVSDCTGHGLSGAMMSMLGISFLNQIVTLPGSEEFTAAEILNQLRSFVVQSLHQQGENLEVHDGMDIAFCIFDFELMQLEFAAAYNSVYLIKHNEKNNEYKLHTYKGDPVPVGIHIKNHDFTNHIIKLEKDDLLYLFTDGIIDQFGGPNDKKFLAKNFKELLVSNAHLPLASQGEIISKTFENWMGYNFQVDDVTVVGLKI